MHAARHERTLGIELEPDGGNLLPLVTKAYVGMGDPQRRPAVGFLTLATTRTGTG